MSAVDDARFAAMRTEAARRIRAAQIAQDGPKRCPRCQQIKPRSAFGRNALKADGLSVYCRTCRINIK